MTTAIEIVKDNGYSVDTWENFTADPKLPAGLLDRAVEIKAECEARGEIVTHVVYDTNHHDQGFIVMGDNPEELSWELSDLALEHDERWADVERPSRLSI